MNLVLLLFFLFSFHQTANAQTAPIRLPRLNYIRLFDTGRRVVCSGPVAGQNLRQETRLRHSAQPGVCGAGRGQRLLLLFRLLSRHRLPLSNFRHGATCKVADVVHIFVWRSAACSALPGTHFESASKGMSHHGPSP